ncbi:hypothetical protein VSDG_06581 [Cytospora chrysosperma]|uniref:Uncharacterized protein n=1 Tax=Cytospora chrysosperma TaxID=252740 RepID=A0A423VNQ4_CYTCH|nr:hypothetical protein VSDG_06581 [Valsa sordida]
MAAPDLDDPPTSNPSPRRPAGPLRSSTFGELPPQAHQQAGNMSPQQESRQEEIAPDKLELDLNAGVYTCASLRRRLGSIGSNNNNNNKDNNVGVTAGSRHHDVEVQAHAKAPQREQLHHEEDKEQWSTHKEGERWPLGEETEEDGDEYEDEDEDEDEDELEAGHGGRGEARAAETGTARVAHLVARGAVSMVDIRRRTPPSLLPSSRTVRDISSLPDLAWAQSLTTGGGRAVTSAASAADLVGSGVCKETKT